MTTDWRRSSQCQGGGCVEAAQIVSSHCTTGECVEVAWTSRCDSGACVEVATSTGAVLVRDSKDPDAGTIAYTPAQWAVKTAAMRSAYADGERSHWLPSHVSRRSDGYVWHQDGVTLRFTPAEWDAFVDGVLAREFEVDRLAEVADRG